MDWLQRVLLLPHLYAPFRDRSRFDCQEARLKPTRLGFIAILKLVQRMQVQVLSLSKTSLQEKEKIIPTFSSIPLWVKQNLQDSSQDRSVMLSVVQVDHYHLCLVNPSQTGDFQSQFRGDLFVASMSPLWIQGIQIP